MQEQQQQQPPPQRPPAYTTAPVLPGIRSLHLPDGRAHAPAHTQPTHAQPPWASLPPLAPRAGSPMDTTCDAPARPRATSVVSVDDPDVRLAAEALSGLGSLAFTPSPTAPAPPHPEPLLSLITSNHPWLGGTIHGSISAYHTTKGYTPRFVQYGAGFLERNIASPVVNTVSSVGRRTGVEQNLRRYLGDTHDRPADVEEGDLAARKRQRVASTSPSLRPRRESLSAYPEPLPAYDDHRSPEYEEKPATTAAHAQPDRPTAWSTQLIMTTSGLGVALSDASLRSLRTCLTLLRYATHHIDSAMHALRLVVQEYEIALRNQRQADGAASPDTMDTSSTAASDSPKDEQVRLIADRMKAISNDIWDTLKGISKSVSRYTGGALPQNASAIVRTQLMSMPQRWQSVSRSAAAENGEDVRGAHRMLAFAQEGLDMMAQVTTVVDGTVQSAEGWLSRIGRTPPAREDDEAEKDQKLPPTPSGHVWANGDEKH